MKKGILELFSAFSVILFSMKIAFPADVGESFRQRFEKIKSPSNFTSYPINTLSHPYENLDIPSVQIEPEKRKVDVSYGKSESFQDMNLQINLKTASLDIELVLNEEKTVEITGKLWKTSLAPFGELIWLESSTATKEIEVNTVDAMMAASSAFLMDTQKDLINKPVLRLVFTDFLTQRLFVLFFETTIEMAKSFFSCASFLTSMDANYSKMQDSVLLNYNQANFYLMDISPEKSDYSISFQSNESKKDKEVFLQKNRSVTKKESYGSTARGSQYIPSLDITITDWGSNFLLDTIFPSVSSLSRLIDTYSYGSVFPITDNCYGFIYEKSWINAFYPQWILSTYLECELQGAADGIELKIKFADFYRYNTVTKQLLYSEKDGNSWLEEFAFRLSASQNINYLRVSKAGLWEWPHFTEVNWSQVVLHFLFSMGGLVPLSTIATMFKFFTDPGGYQEENEEYEMLERTFVYNEYNEIPIQETELSFVIDPQYILMISDPKEDYTLASSRWKSLFVDIRYVSTLGDVTPASFSFTFNFKRHMVYSDGQNAILDSTLLGGVFYYILPSGC